MYMYARHPSPTAIDRVSTSHRANASDASPATPKTQSDSIVTHARLDHGVGKHHRVERTGTSDDKIRTASVDRARRRVASSRASSRVDPRASLPPAAARGDAAFDARAAVKTRVSTVGGR